MLIFGKSTFGQTIPVVSVTGPALAANVHGSYSFVSTTSSPTVVNAPVVGNGDMALMIGGPSRSLSFCVGKSDFWGVEHGVIMPVGSLVLQVPALSGSSYSLVQNVGAATVTGSFTTTGNGLGLCVWTAASQNTAFIQLNAGNTAIAIKNSSTLDANYTNTFDNQLQSAFTLTFWAKGFPTVWNYMVSKNGDSGSPESGWTLRRQGYYSNNNPCWTMREPGGTLVLGADSYGSTDDMGTSTMNLADGNWHFYAGTYNKGTGYRSLCVDGVLVAQETGNGLITCPRWNISSSAA